MPVSFELAASPYYDNPFHQQQILAILRSTALIKKEDDSGGRLSKIAEDGIATSVTDTNVAVYVITKVFHCDDRGHLGSDKEKAVDVKYKNVYYRVVIDKYDNGKLRAICVTQIKKPLTPELKKSKAEATVKGKGSWVPGPIGDCADAAVYPLQIGLHRDPIQPDNVQNVVVS
jgi:hypothetical protein